MIRSLYAGVSGMRNFQTKMDAIGNNIANVNTTAFKSGRVRFQDMLSQTVATAQAPTANGLGGVNAQQIGLGVKVGAIDTIMTGGALQPTNRGLDFAIEGEGFFAVSQDSAGVLKSYTRDGAFYTDYEGNLVNAGGLRVLGYIKPVGDDYLTTDVIPSNLEVPTGAATDLDLLQPLTIPDPITVGGLDLDLESYTIDGTGKIIGVYSDGNAYLLGQVGMVSFSNPEGLQKTGSNNYANTNNSGQPQAGTAGNSGYGVVRQGFLEMSNVDLANEFTEMIVTSRAYQANSRTISTSDEMLQELINLKR
ncbi:flagellar hook-basal body complex protein [Alkalibaculum sp. M08DMB]|uniref:Flagellar hook protein FlgE n=1 Tax=Alkalibaculum sporogenes TaxID=2655001 RepID=A0A6A7K5P5_9FIRM|nr:flagellar hook-basal body complex protein [Alkalibaculum sporogenes]MPW24799.1 flagellar hook-basal body complex protein [Alkalibaculum sporogenes]